MAAITVTPALVRPLNGAVLRRYNTGATVTPGQGIYVASDGDVEPADGDDVDQAQARGVAISDGVGSVSFPAATRIDAVVHGPVAGFSGMTPGKIVYVSPTAGALDHTPSATTGDFNYAIGYAESATVLFVDPQITVPVAVS